MITRMHNPVNTAISFVLLLATVGASFAYVSGNPVEAPKQPWLGISVSNITPALAQELDLEEARGVLIVEVQAGSPAATGGLQGGDVNRIVEVDGEPIALGGDVVKGVDGTPIANVDDLRRVLETKVVGDTIEFTVIRDGAADPVDILVTLGER